MSRCERRRALVLALALVTVSAPGVAAVWGADGPRDALAAAVEAAETRLDRAALERALAAAAGEPYWAARAELALATVLERDGRRDAARARAWAAVEAARHAVDAERGHADAHRVLGEALGRAIGLGGRWDAFRWGPAAHESLALAIRLDPRNARAHLAQGIARLKTPRLFGGGPEAALESIERARQLAPERWETWAWRGLALAERGDPAGARAALAQALVRSPGNPWLVERLAALPGAR